MSDKISPISEFAKGMPQPPESKNWLEKAPQPLQDQVNQYVMDCFPDGRMRSDTSLNHMCKVIMAFIDKHYFDKVPRMSSSAVRNALLKIMRREQLDL
jgi:hypothetical protein